MNGYDEAVRHEVEHVSLHAVYLVALSMTDQNLKMNSCFFFTEGLFKKEKERNYPCCLFLVLQSGHSLLQYCHDTDGVNLQVLVEPRRIHNETINVRKSGRILGIKP